MTRGRLIALLAAAGVLLVVAIAAAGLSTAGGSGKLDVYSARSHYGEERPFRDFAARTGADLRLFGGSASELYERIRAEDERTPADVLITVDAANLWRAERAGLLRPVSSPALERNVPRNLRDPGGSWYGLTVRARTIMRSTERVKPDAVTTYEGLGDARWKDRLCLRSGTSEYNVSFVADRLAKDGPAGTERMLRRWMANEPEILGSDVEVLEAIAGGRCDVGLANSYYLGRKLEEDPGFPVAPVWADQRGRGTHVNLSGLGVVVPSDRVDEATRLIEFLTRPEQQRVFARTGHEFAVNSDVPPSEEIARFGRFKRDPIDVEAAGARLGRALRLMDRVGWD